MQNKTQTFLQKKLIEQILTFKFKDTDKPVKGTIKLYRRNGFYYCVDCSGISECALPKKIKPH